MTANAVVRARIDEQTKTEAAAVLSAMGLTVSDAFRMMLVKIAKEKALPFEPLVPNEETIEAMRAARRGDLVTGGPPGELLTSLNGGYHPPQPFAAQLQAGEIGTAQQAPRRRSARNRHAAGEGRAVAPALFRSPARRRVERSPRLSYQARPHFDL